ncbi:PIG-L family deacetylase [Undibacterium sp. Jales W-56]|uniref:PIG-L deacetylase family protein n=1 Tax=Undibacterium sp. Jales W-56 TaxID=2897325 RepID=UPI0021D2D83F|nr:PIG-L deacetylase family protein [Undibacterium sp. Jales W-56]MCU6433894.1 PIG-L family deacetylase [Undibacterium sp. Jales W-56]
MPTIDQQHVVLCIAPHPDDETLGCGMTLLRHIAEGAAVHWLIMTTMHPEQGFSAERIASRNTEIEQVARAYGFFNVHHASLPTTQLDTLSMSEMVGAVAKVVGAIRPETVYLPYRNDVHSDHAVVFDAAAACCKNFRYPSIRRVYAYETLSETEFGLRPDDTGFRPNLFVDGTPWLDRKIEVMNLFKSEMGEFPFPRSEECLRAQAMLRGSQSGVRAAEAFMILKEIR